MRAFSLRCGCSQGRFTAAAKIQSEVADLCEEIDDSASAIEAYQSAADYYQAEEQHSTANQMLLKLAGLAAKAGDYKKAVGIYEQVRARARAAGGA